MHPDEMQEAQSPVEKSQIKLCHVISNTMNKNHISPSFALN